MEPKPPRRRPAWTVERLCALVEVDDRHDDGGGGGGGGGGADTEPTRGSTLTYALDWVFCALRTPSSDRVNTPTFFAPAGSINAREATDVRTLAHSNHARAMVQPGDIDQLVKILREEAPRLHTLKYGRGCDVTWSVYALTEVGVGPVPGTRSVLHLT